MCASHLFFLRGKQVLFKFLVSGVALIAVQLLSRSVGAFSITASHGSHVCQHLLLYNLHKHRTSGLFPVMSAARHVQS